MFKPQPNLPPPSHFASCTVRKSLCFWKLKTACILILTSRTVGN